jgi:hypothetical protein
MSDSCNDLIIRFVVGQRMFNFFLYRHTLPQQTRKHAAPTHTQGPHMDRRHGHAGGGHDANHVIAEGIS